MEESYTSTKIEYVPYEWDGRDEQEKWEKRHREKDIKIRKPQKELQMAVQNILPKTTIAKRCISAFYQFS